MFGWVAIVYLGQGLGWVSGPMAVSDVLRLMFGWVGIVCLGQGLGWVSGPLVCVSVSHFSCTYRQCISV